MRLLFSPHTQLMRDTLRAVEKYEMIADKVFFESSSDWKCVHSGSVVIWHNEATSKAVIRFEYIPFIENNKHFEFELKNGSDAGYCATSILATILCHAHCVLERSEKHGKLLESYIEKWSKEREEHRDEIGQAG